MRGFFIKKSVALIITTIVLVGLFSFSNIAQAILYSPGATLNPACLPTDLNCDVLLITSGFQPTIATGTTAQYFRGDLSLSTFPTLLSSFTNDLNYLTKVFTSGPFIGAGTSTSPLTFLQASSTADGYLSQIDWNTFNNKLSTTTAFTTYVPYSYASSTFPTYTYASSTYYFSSNPSGYISSTTSSLNNYPTYTYASSTYYFASNPNSYITATALTPYLSTTSAASTYVPYTGATTNIDLNTKTLANVSTLSVASTTAPTGGVAYFNGNVGIGTASPTATLHVSDAVSAAIKIQTADVAASITNAYDYLSAIIGNATLVLQRVSGNIGIGTTTPASKLDIYGTAGTADIFGISSSSNSRLFTVSYNGSTTIASLNQAGFVKSTLGGALYNDTNTYLTTASAGTTYVPYSYASSTFPTYTYASSTYYFSSNPSGYISSTTSSLNNYPTYTYASSTFPSFGYASSTFAQLAGATFTGTISSPNFSGTSTGSNTGDVTLVNNINGLTLSGQALTLGLSGTSATGTLSATDWNTFNNKLSTAAAASTYVPYTGATTNVDLNTKTLSNVSTLSVGSVTAPTGGVAYFNGNVGIGTSTPGSILTVNTGATNGSILLNSTNAGGNRISYDLNTYYRNTQMYLTDTGNTGFGIQTGYPTATTTLFIADSGNVGIGTVSPGTKLDVNGDIQSEGTVLRVFNAGSAETEVTSGTSYGYFGTRNNFPLGFYTNNGSNAMTILTNGNVGIGTVSPGHPLDVVANEGATGTDKIIGNFYKTATNSGGSSIVRIGTTGNAYVTDLEQNSGTIIPTYGAYTDFNIRPSYSAGGKYGNINFITGNGAGGYQIAMTVGANDQKGNIGIGTATPGSKLEVTGAYVDPDATAHGIAEFNSNTSFAIDKGGAVSFGGAYTGSTVTQFGSIIGAKENITDTNYAGYLAFHTRPAGSTALERMRITSTGNVGIGTINPANKFVVAGASSTRGLEINPDASGVFYIFPYDRGSPAYLPLRIIGSTIQMDNGGTPAFYINATGNVGIGTATPGNYKLAIDGGSAGSMSWGSGSVQGILSYDPSKAHILGATGNSLDFGSNGIIDRMVMDTSGNVGIGTTSPRGPLDVKGVIYTQSSTNGNITSYIGHASGVDTGVMTLYYGGTGAIQLFANPGVPSYFNAGNVGIGTTVPVAPLQVTSNGNGYGAIQIGQNGINNGSAFLYFAPSNAVTNWKISTNDTISGDLEFAPSIAAGSTTWATAAMAMNSSGNLGIGVAPDTTYKLKVNGQPAANGYTAWTNYSDERLKENITPFSNSSSSLEDLLKLNPVTYNYNSLTGYDTQTRSRRISGFIAQELQTVFPEMVGTTTINGTEYLDTNLSDLPLYIVQAIKEQQKQIMSFVSKIQDGITYLRNIVVETLVIGSHDKPSGITMYDEATGNPYCVKIINGNLRNENGSCDAIVASVVAPTPSIVSNTSSTTNAGFDYTATVLDASKVFIKPDNATSSTPNSKFPTPSLESVAVENTFSASYINATHSSSAVQVPTPTSSSTSPAVSEQVSVSTNSGGGRTSQASIASTPSSSTNQIVSQPTSTSFISSEITATTTPTVVATSTEQATSSISSAQIIPSIAISTPATSPVEQVATSTPTTSAVAITTPDQSTSTIQNPAVTVPAPQSSQTASSSSVASSTDSQLPASVILAKIPEETLLVLVLMIQGLMILAFGLYVYSRKGIK